MALNKHATKYGERVGRATPALSTFSPKAKGRGREERPLTPEAIVKEYAEKFYKSRAWKHTRQAYLEKVGGLCERCLKRGLYVPAEIVHHRVHISPENINDPTVTLDQRNLEALCRDCHAAEHDKSGKRYTVDEFGRVRLRISPR